MNSDLLVGLVKVEGELLEDSCRDALIEAKHRLAFHHSIEFVLDNASLDTWTKELHESGKLLLALETTLIGNDIISNFILQRPWQFQMLDCSVDLCQLGLEFG